MNCISLWQPWAQGIVLGIKTNETRGWKTNIRGRVAIHAAKKIVPVADLPANVTTTLWERSYHSMADLPHGEIIGTVEIVDCVPVETIRDSLTPLELAWGDYSPGRFAWRLANPVMLELPIPYTGRQGFFWISDTILPYGGLQP